MAKTERQKAVAYADKWFSLFIRQRDKRCYCGRFKDEPMQCCHLFSRANYSTRWDDKYAFSGHSGCNLSHEYHPEIMTLWFINKYGKDAYEVGVAKHHGVAKFSNSDLMTIGNEYKARYEKLLQV